MLDFFEYKYFTVKQQPLQPGRKTHVYLVINNREKYTIGRIEWYGPWRQFCFFPDAGTVWSAGCLDDIQDMLRSLAKPAR